ncbi:MAG: hypothetical protein ACKO5R_01295 [Planctomycetaceae bacterium]
MNRSPAAPAPLPLAAPSRRWRSRLRLTAAVLASLGLHAALQRSLERITLSVRPADDAARDPGPLFRPELATDFPLQDDPRVREEAVHERPIDAPLPAEAAARPLEREPDRVAAALEAPAPEAPPEVAATPVPRPAPTAGEAVPAEPKGVERDAPAALPADEAAQAAAEALDAADDLASLPGDTGPTVAARRRGPAAAAAGPVTVRAADGPPLVAALAPPRPPVPGRRRPSEPVAAPPSLSRAGVEAGRDVDRPMVGMPDDGDGVPDGPGAVEPPAGAPGAATAASPAPFPAPRSSARTLRTGPVASRGAAGTMPAEPVGGAGESLSVVPPPRLPPGRTQPAVAAPALPASPAPGLSRAAAVTLPAETRVRETAEAFARRARAARAPSPADATVESGLDWLARTQERDGRWTLGRYAADGAGGAVRLRSDTAATGLALLAFLGAGYDHFEGPHRDTVRRGLEWLVSVQKEDGDLFLPADPVSNACAWLYSHGIATTALCEAVGMTGDPLLRPAAQKALGFVVAAQQPARGGWRYRPRTDSDLSVSGWMLVALRAGALAGLEVPPEAFDGVRRFLDESALPDRPGGYAYNPREPEQRQSEVSASCMTALGTLMRLHTGTPTADPGVAAAADALAAARPSWGSRERPVRDAYLWYYTSQVLVHTSGDAWEAWYRGLGTVLAARQTRDGPQAGSWDPLGPLPDRWGAYGGRLYVTCLHLLALEVPYRHLPTYRVSDAPRE